MEYNNLLRFKYVLCIYKLIYKRQKNMYPLLLLLSPRNDKNFLSKIENTPCYIFHGPII